MPSKLNIESYVSNDVLDMSLLQLSDFPLKNKNGLSKNVTSLNFSNNLLTSVPPALCSFIHIREIDLSKNKLKALPDQFGDLVNLRRLDLYDNQLSFLPLSFCKLKKLKWLDISSNPMPQALMGIAGPCQNAKECENAAQKIVTYFGLLNIQVCEEYEKVKKAEKEKLENEDQAVVVKTKKQKNNKNANRKDAGEGGDGKIGVTEKFAAAVTANEGQQTKKISLWRYLFFYVFAFIILMIAYAWANDVQLTDIVQCIKTANGCSEILLKLRGHSYT